jgi:AraC-like DNA-binding protein
VSKTRQTAFFDPSPRDRSTISTFSRDYPTGHRIPLHFHIRDQLIFASRGVMTVSANHGAWVVPVHRAVWITAKSAHTIAMSGNVSMRTLYLRPGLADSLPRECCVVNVSPLLKELILHACRIGSLRRALAWQSHLIDVIIDQLQTIKAAPLQLSLPEDPRAVRIANAVLANPSDPRRLGQLARTSGASGRTIERLFVVETGTIFGKWRQQVRLMEAMRLLGGGANVTEAAFEAGYCSSSAFIAAFRKMLGSSPTQYFRDPAAGYGPRIQRRR